MKKTILKNCAGVVLIAGLAIFANAGDNIIKNGDFEKITNENKFENWKHGRDVTQEKDGKNQFARIKNSNAGGYTSFSQDFEVKADWEKLTLMMRMRVNSDNDKSRNFAGYQNFV